MAPASKAAPRSADPVPKGFRIARDTPVGRHPLLAVFPGLDGLEAAARLEPDAAQRGRLFDETCVEIVDQDLWMYVAPKALPKFRRAEWKPVISPGADCIVVGVGHLRDSPALMLFMDIYHELCHVIQRQHGAELWPPGVSYVDRWTEVDAYRFVVDEARRLGVSNAFLQEYLRVEWISEAEHRSLLEKMDVPAE